MTTLQRLMQRWREDAGSTYRTWFLWEERLKNFRSIRRGLQEVVRDIEADTFGTQYRDSSLEIVVHSVTEQRQIVARARRTHLSSQDHGRVAYPTTSRLTAKPILTLIRFPCKLGKR